MTKAAALLAVCAVLAACSGGQDTARENPFAPGLSQRGDPVDGTIVGHRLMAAGEYELAVDAFSRAALTDGMSAEVLAGLGSAHLGMGQLGTAERMLRDAIDTDENAPEIWNNLGVVLMEKGKTAEAAQIFRRAYAFDNGESDAIRDNLRLALAKMEKSYYADVQEQDYKLVRRGSSDYLIRRVSG